MNDNINILDLPDIVLENILSFLTYDEIAKNRLVCKKFDSTCKSLLNRGFVVVERRQSLVSRTIRHCLPRRESERRAHPLARHCEILSALETRISMLSMTFMKFIDTGLCCFIPGKVIDEILHILKVVQKSTSPPRTHDLLQELRDISSMAMEHFEEFIVPSLRLADANNVPVNKSLFQSPGLKRTGRRSPILVSDLIRREFKTINHNTKIYRQQLCGMKKLLAKLNQKVKSQDNLLTYQACKLRKQRRLIQEQTNCISDVKKHLEECDRKISDLTIELNRTRDKTTNNKASQTNEYNNSGSNSNNVKLIREHSSDALKDESLPSSILNEMNMNTARLSLPSSFKMTTYHHHYQSSSNIDDITSLTDEFDKNHVKEFISKSLYSYPTRRTTLSDFRSSNNAAQQKFNTDTSEHHANEMANTRKRKIIDLIANVVDSKTPTKPIDQAEITQLLRKYPRLNEHYYSSTTCVDDDVEDDNGLNLYEKLKNKRYDDDNDIHLLEKLKGKRRLQRYIDVSDEIPSKRLVGKFRQI